MANASILQKNLRLGVNEPLYTATAGAINATGTAGTAPNGTFTLPPQCSNYRGTIVFQGIPIGGTVTSAVFQLEGSIDGVTFDILNVTFGVTGAPSTLTRYSGFDIAAANTHLIALNLSGCGGMGQLRLNFTTLTLGTGSGLNVWAHIG